MSCLGGFAVRYQSCLPDHNGRDGEPPQYVSCLATFRERCMGSSATRCAGFPNTSFWGPVGPASRDRNRPRLALRDDPALSFVGHGRRKKQEEVCVEPKRRGNQRVGLAPSTTIPSFSVFHADSRMRTRRRATCSSCEDDKGDRSTAPLTRVRGRGLQPMRPALQAPEHSVALDSGVEDNEAH